MLVSCRQRGQRSWNAAIVRSTAHGPTRSRSASVSSSTVSSASASAPPIPAMTSSTSSGVKPTGAGCIGDAWGRADSAPVHIGRSAVARRWTVPRGPNVLTMRAIDPQRALDVGARQAGAPRDGHLARLQDLGVGAADRPGDVGRVGVCAAGSTSELRSMRRAVTPVQVSAAVGRRTAALSTRP